MDTRGHKVRLLLSSSVAALLVGGGAPAAWAACTNGAGGGAGFDNPAAHTTPCVAVTNTSFSGTITNEGTIAPGGITFSNGTITVATPTAVITSTGTIAGGISLDANSAISNSNGFAISIGGAFTGGISNAGKVTARGIGIDVNVSSFSGDLSNSGTISSFGFGEAIFINASTFSGNLSNSGTISTAPNSGAGGIKFQGMSTFAGTLTNSGTISSIGGIDVATISAFSGSISNSGTITGNVAAGGNSNVGDGIIVELVSAFSGTIANGGTISVSAASGVVLNGNGILINLVSTFAGNISNSGTISTSGSAGLFSGSGIAVDGVSTFAGNISNSGTISAVQNGIFVGGTSALSGTIANSGTITGAVGIIAAGAGGVSIFDSGTITSTVGASGAAIDLTQATGHNTVTLAPGYSITGKVLGAGSDTLQLGGSGSGTFDLSTVGAPRQYQGFTTFNVVSGTWTVSNTFGQTQAWNVNGGVLAGTGTLSALNVNNGGTLAPGTIGTAGTTMSVTGNLTFQSGATYLVNVAPTTASRVKVGGAATLAGGVLGPLAPGSYSGRTTYDILDAASISGAFTGFTDNLPGFGGTLTYTPTSVLLNLTALLGAGSALNPNQQAVANTINNFFNTGGTLPANFFPLFALTGGNLGNALTPLTGEAATGAGNGASRLMTQFLDLMLDPSIEGRGGAGGGVSMFAPERDASLPPDIALAYEGALKAAPAAPAWTSWAAGFGGYNRTNGDAGAGTHDVIARDFGSVAGIDHRITPETVVGVALGGGGTNWGLAQGLGSGRSDAFLAGVHARMLFGPAYVSAGLAFSNHWITTNQVALGDQLSASFSGQSFGARLEVGYHYGVPAATGSFGVTPYGAVQTQVFYTPSYTETDLNGGAVALAFADKRATDTRSELGARFDNLTLISDKPLALSARVAWAHDWVSTPSLSAAFQALPGPSFTVNGAILPANSLLTSTSAEVAITSAWSLAGKFDGEFARGSQTYAGTGTVRYRW